MALARRIDRREKSNGCAYCDRADRLPDPAHAEHLAAAEPAAASLDDLIGGVERRHLHHRHRKLEHRSAARQFPVRRPALLRIKNGKLGPMLRDVAYQGRTVEFWNSLDGWASLDLFSRRHVQLRQRPAGRARPYRMARCRRGFAAYGAEHRARGYLTHEPHARRGQGRHRSPAGRVARRSLHRPCHGGEKLNLRFARNSATSNGAVSAVEVTITRNSASDPARRR